MEQDNEQLFLNLEQRYVSLKNEHDAVCRERDFIKGNLLY